MKYTLSINIAQTTFDPNSYIVTQNAIKVIGNIVNSFNAGVHSFNIIGSYGTGKSNFILALEDSLKIIVRFSLPTRDSLMVLFDSGSRKL